MSTAEAVLSAHDFQFVASMARDLAAIEIEAGKEYLVQARLTPLSTNAGPFEALRKTVIPQLMEKRRAMKVLRIWSAAASTGQEAYSFCVLLKEAFPELASWDVAPDGYLLLGSSENLLQTGEEFDAVEIDNSLFYQPKP